jgi:hypothetical protein
MWGKWSGGLFIFSSIHSCSMGASEWDGGGKYGNLYRDSFCLGREG